MQGAGLSEKYWAIMRLLAVISIKVDRQMFKDNSSHNIRVAMI